MSSEVSGWSVVQNWIVRGDALDAYEKLVYLALISRSNDYGYTWPSIATLARDAGCSERTVRDRLRKLEERGLVETQNRSRDDGGVTSNMYKVEVFRPGSERRPPRQEMPTPSAAVAAEERPIELRPIELTSAGAESVFDEVWKWWPKKDKRKPALTKFLRLAEDHPVEWLADQVKRFGDAYTAAGTDPQFVPALVVWLNQERWTDPLPQSPQQQAKPVQQSNADWDWMTR